MTFHSATFTPLDQTRRNGAAVVVELMEGALRAAEVQSFKILDAGLTDGEPDPGKDRRRPLPRGTQLAPWCVKKLERFIAENLDRTLNLETLAAVGRLSCSHFARACKNTLGMTPRQVVLRHRIERAQALLRDTRTPLSQIALVCGFSDQAHFSRLFRQEVGTTPRGWRRDNPAPSPN